MINSKKKYKSNPIGHDIEDLYCLISGLSNSSFTKLKQTKMTAYRFFRDSFWGVLINRLSKHKLAPQKEEYPDYIVPEKYYGNEKIVDDDLKNKEFSEGTNQSLHSSSESENSSDTIKATPDEDSQQIIVTWDGDDDPDNPYNWPLHNKIFFMISICFVTISVYMASAIYTPGIEEIMEEFQISQTVATLPLSLFVVGYGLGTNIFSPLSENARYGKTSIYIVTLFIFFLFQIGAAESKNIATLCILRFFGGFFGSPCLATGGASMGDVLHISNLVIGIATWSLAAVCGPSIGPLIGGALINRWNWRAPFWFMAILSGSSFLILGFLLPESYGKTLLYRKAIRLRALTGNENITSEGELELKGRTSREIMLDIIWRPIEVMIFEPVVLLINIYIALVYSIMYVWFEAFPMLYTQVYHFTIVEMGAAFLSICIGIVIGAAFYIPIIRRQFTLPFKAGKPIAPEVFLPMAIIGSILMPCGLIIFAWTSSPKVHWIGSLFGAGIFAGGAFLVFQTLFNYLSFSFTRYLASVFASNNLMRSNTAAFFPIIGKFLFGNLSTPNYPVAWGTMILAFISMAMILIPVLFYLNGPKLRARSKYAN